MAKADKKSSTPAQPYAEPDDVRRRPPYFGEREATVHIISASEPVHLRPSAFMRRLIEAAQFGLELAGKLPKLRSGRPPEYDLAAITAVAEEAIGIGVDNHLDWFVERVRGLLAARHIKAPKETRLTDLCRPIYMRASGELPTNTD